MEILEENTNKQQSDHRLHEGITRRRSLSPQKVVLETKQALKKHAARVAKQANRHETFLNKIMYSLGVLGFGTFCFLLGSRPQDIPSLYCLFFIVMAPLRWIYYRFKKWHYYLLDFCYYANAIFITMLLFFPTNEKLFMLCFSFAEGPLAWALIVWRCSLVFSSIDKIVSVFIHLLPGTVFFIIRWWEPTINASGEIGPRPAWPLVSSLADQWTWLFFVPLLVYCVWQALYFLIVEGLRRQRLLNDPEVMTSFRELKRKAERANNIWWRLSGLMGAEKRVYMYAVIQAVFTLATLALTVLLFKSYRLHTWFEVFKLAATVWNGGNYIFEVMPRQVVAKNKRKEEEATTTGLNGKLIKSKSGDVSEVSKSIIGDNGDGNLTNSEDLFCSMCRKPSAENLAESMAVLDAIKSATHID